MEKDLTIAVDIPGEDEVDVTSDIPEMETEDVGTMLPTVGLNGKEIKKDKSIIDDIHLSESVIRYMNDIDTSYDEYVDEGVREFAGKITERITVSGKTAKYVVDIYILKKRLKAALKFKDEKKVIDLKRQLIQKQKEFNQIKKTASPQLKEEIKKVEANLDKATKRTDTKIEDLEKEESVDDILNVTESAIYIESDDKEKKEVSPELKRLDEVRGRISELEKHIKELKINLETAKLKAIDSGEKLYDNKVKGITSQIDKSEKDLKELKDKLADGEKKLKKEEEQLTSESSIYSEAQLNVLDNKIKIINESILEVKKEILAQMEKLKHAKLAGEYGLYERKIIHLKKKMDDMKEKLSLVKKQRGEQNSSMNESFDEYTYSDDMYMTESADMESEIKPIVDELNRKGYKVKYASPGHEKLRKKEDKNHDGAYYNKLYSDARIMFKKKYNFPDAPDCWHWRDVDGCSYLDITPVSHDEKKEDADAHFTRWKDEYMRNLKVYVHNLKNISSKDDSSDEDVKESLDEYTYSMMDELFENVESSDFNLNEIPFIESVREVDSTKEKLLSELDSLLN